MSESLLIRGGRVIDPSAGLDGELDILVRNGTVETIAPAIEPGTARLIDARGCIVAPGFVDLHTHLREPGFEHKGTIASETRAALRGGFTTVCAMPNTEPPPDSATAVEALLERIAQDAAVRVLPIGCVTRGRNGRELAELGELAAAGCIAFSDDGSPVADGRLMRNALQYAAALGLPLSEHCDDPVLSAGGTMNEGRISERLGLSGQPAAAEVAAIARNTALCEATGARLHIAHITTERGLALVAEARQRGLPISCEVTPSHLFLTEEAVFGDGPAPAYDTNAKVNPPLRTAADRAALSSGVNAGIIDAIATDHAPHAIQDKLCEFDQAAFGISCIETALSTVVSLALRGELDLIRAIGALTIGPVRAFGIDRRVPGAGTLAPGRAGDITVFDPAARWQAGPGTLVSKGKNTPLLGRELPGRVRAVVLRGELAHLEEPAHA
ncbi:MAG: dihydroorotase [Dehalococcoidia bacterium]|nr:dihydroorotase [Chloroflexi bacterium CFX7]NUQ55083.1 dihydroorotase [Dehalococcoidia bacterium]RIL01768.1 MAG: dihydroorotase [bacterium]